MQSAISETSQQDQPASRPERRASVYVSAHHLALMINRVKKILPDEIYEDVADMFYQRDSKHRTFAPYVITIQQYKLMIAATSGHILCVASLPISYNETIDNYDGSDEHGLTRSTLDADAPALVVGLATLDPLLALATTPGATIDRDCELTLAHSGIRDGASAELSIATRHGMASTTIDGSSDVYGLFTRTRHIDPYNDDESDHMAGYYDMIMRYAAWIDFVSIAVDTQDIRAHFVRNQEGPQERPAGRWHVYRREQLCRAIGVSKDFQPGAIRVDLRQYKDGILELATSAYAAQSDAPKFRSFVTPYTRSIDEIA